MDRTRTLVLPGTFLGSILSLIMLAGPGAAAGSPPPGDSGSGSTSSSTIASKFIYGGPGFESGSVEAGSINSNNGVVTAVAGSPFSENMAEPDMLQVTADRQGRFVYVLNQAAFPGTDSGIGGFAINQQTGALSLVPGSPVVFSQDNNNFMAIDGTGHFLFEPNGAGSGGSSTAFDVYSIDQNTGALTKTSSTSNTPPVGRFSIASTDGHFVFNAGNGLVAAYSMNSQTGQLTAVPGTPTSTGGSAGPMAITSDGHFLYVANETEGTLSIFAVSTTGTLAPVAGSPFTIDNGAQFLALTPNGEFLYVAFHTQSNGTFDNIVKGYAVNPAAGTFAPISRAVVNSATSATMDQSGTFVYISVGRNLVTYRIDPNTGALTQTSQTSALFTDNWPDMVTVP